MKPFIFLALAAAPLFVQMHDNQERTMTCDSGDHGSHHAHHCEIREQTMAAPRGSIQVNPGTNGGVTIKGWSRADMLVRARIDTSAPADADARAIAGQVNPFASGAGVIKPSGPESMGDNRWWSVSYEIFVPQQSDISANAHNGGVRIMDVKGKITFTALNGGVHLSRLAGDVSGSATNGGLHIELAGNRWDGAGMNVSTTNGGVQIQAPANYAAHFEAATVNGGIRSDFPITVQGKIGRDLAFDLGGGGPTIRATTTNGGVKIQKSEI
jgi:hypothetical protein